MKFIRCVAPAYHQGYKYLSSFHVFSCGGGVQVWMCVKSLVRLPHRGQKFCSVRCAGCAALLDGYVCPLAHLSFPFGRLSR